MSDVYKYYIVYRMDDRGKGTAYGWTFDKKILKTFLTQRSKNKYKALRANYDDILELFSEQVDGSGMYTIDWMDLPSNQTGENIRLFLTANEKIVAEKAIKKMLRDMSALDRIHGEIEDYVEMVVNLEEKYFEALEFIGFRPKELEAIFDSIEENSMIGFNCDTGAYYDMSPEEFYQSHNLSSGDATNPVFDKILWSLEAFVRVMKDDL